MRTFGRILGRLIAVAVSYVIACIAAGLMVAGGVVLKAWLADAIAISQARLLTETLFVSGLVASVVSVYAFAPAVIVIVVAEVFAIRRAIYYVVCGAIAGLIGFAAFTRHDLATAPFLARDLALIAGAGIVAGFVYWYLAGRSAGVLERPAA